MRVRHSMALRRNPPHPLLTGVAAGLLAGLVTGMTDKVFDRLVSEEQKRRDRKVREASAHEVAGPLFAARLVGHGLTEEGNRQAKAIFNVAYGVGWGLVYTAVRKRIPLLSRLAALPFGVLFFAACDGMLAPLLKVSPPLRRLPWQPNVKELGNHLAWSTAAEMVHRTAARYGVR